MFNDSKSVKSLLWGQTCSTNFPDHFLPQSMRIHRLRTPNRDALIEAALCVRPDTILCEMQIPGDKSWSQIANTLRGRLKGLRLTMIVTEFDTESIRDLVQGQYNAIINGNRVHLELPLAFKALQFEELYITDAAVRSICNIVQQQPLTMESKGDRGLLTVLTNRELEVLAHLVEGLNYKAIAKILFVSDSTLKTHVNNIFTKLNVNDRTQAVLYGLRHGIERLMPSATGRIGGVEPAISHQRDLADVTSAKQLTSARA